MRKPRKSSHFLGLFATIYILDTDYNGESFFVRQAYFLGGQEPYEKLKRALRAEIDEGEWSKLYSARRGGMEWSRGNGMPTGLKAKADAVGVAPWPGLYFLPSIFTSTSYTLTSPALSVVRSLLVSLYSGGMNCSSSST